MDTCDFFLDDSGFAFPVPDPEGVLCFAGVLGKSDTSWGVDTAVIHSTNEAGQLAEQLGGPKNTSSP